VSPGPNPDNLLTNHWGQGILETIENIQRTLQDVVQIAHNVITENIQSTFVMLPTNVTYMEPLGTF
jgi:hypothetical protein